MLYGRYNNRYKCRLCEKVRKQEERDRVLATGNDGQLYIRSVLNEQNVRGAI